VSKNNDSSTKKRILQAARLVFASRGLASATVREICTQAGANVAAVSYYYGSKEKLYISVLEDYLANVISRYPFDEGVTDKSTPEECLRSYVRGFLRQTLGDGDPVNEKLGSLLTQEYLEPSQYFSALFEKYCRPTHRQLIAILQRMIPGVGVMDAERCASSIIGQCVLFDFANPALLIMSPELALQESNIGNITDFIMEFSLGGIDRLRNSLSTQAVA
jgi:Transcriptional regulator